MFKHAKSLALVFCLLVSMAFPSSAQTLGPVSSYEALAELLAVAQEGDILLVSGEISAQDAPALTPPVSIRIKADDDATIHGLRLQDASVSFSDITLADSLTICGASHIQLGKNVCVSGSAGKSAVSFSGNGTLIIEGGCIVEGGSAGSGVSIRHLGGEFYSSIEGVVRGGDGSSGGAGVMISPLRESGAVMITGSVYGGAGYGTGGHALNLYDLSGNAHITVDGFLQGGAGSVGGDGIQIVSASDTVCVGVSGQIKGGDGRHHGGNALILMNVRDSSSFHISGHFSGGSALKETALPGTSLHLVGNSASLRARIDNCILEDGRHFFPTPLPSSTPEPTPISTP